MVSNVAARRKTLLLLSVIVLLAAGCGRSEGGSGGEGDGEVQASPGITDTSIKIGGSYPFSGPASGYGTISRGANAYFQYVNDQGGVDGREIEWITYDDAYEPQRALTNARKLVEQDEVFALFNTLGTANNLAIWDYTNQQEVPQVFVASGASNWGADIDSHPWTIGWQPNYVTEARVYADYLQANMPDATVAILYQNDAFGEDLLGGFEDAIDGSNVQIVDRKSYEVTDPSVAPQVTALAASNADVLLNISTPQFGAQAVATVAQTPWRPVHLLNNVAASKTQVLVPVGLENAQDVVTTQYFKDPEDPQWADDPAMTTYKENLAKYEPDADPDEPHNVFGWAAANTLVEALKQMEEPTRESLMESVRSLDVEIPILLPGIRVETSAEDGYPIEAMQIADFEGENYVLQGEVIQAPAT